MSKPYQIQYHFITQKLIDEPNKIGDSRIGKINSRLAEQIRIDLKKEFPLQDIKKVKFSNIVHELLWMINGDTNIKYLIENGCNIWTDDAYRYYKEKFATLLKEESPENQLELDLELTKEAFVEKVLKGDKVTFWDKPKSYWLGEYAQDTYVFGDLDRVYGQQWRNFNGKTDQLQNCIDTLKTNPDDRRMIVTAHNPTDIEDKIVGLPSCHNYFQFYTTKNHDGGRVLSTFVNIRSNDWFLGQPYNVAQYALLTNIIARIVGMEVGELVINSVDTHLYHAHFDAAEEWMARFDKILIDNYVGDQGGYSGDYYDIVGCKAKLKLGHIDNIDNIKASDITLENYNSQGFIKAPLLT